MTSESQRLIDQFTRAHDGDPWHGSPVREILKGVTPAQAARRPPNRAHSIWEIVLHMTGWRLEAAQRATGKPAGEPAAGDYPDIGDPTPARWQQALDALDASHAQLVKVVKGMSDADLLKPTNDPRNRPLGTGVSYYELFHGIVQHDAYHAGQIAILKKVLGFCLLLVAFASGVSAEPLASIPNPRVKNGTWVIDMPGALRPDTEERLNQAIGSVEQSHGIEMAVVVVESLDGLPVEDAAVKLFELWGIGKKGRDNGLLFLWSRGDRRLRVEVGYGLEGVLPDGKVGAILDAYVVPRFKANDFDAGMIAGVDALLAAARSEPVALPAMGNRSYDSDGWLPSWWPMLAGVPVGIGALTAFNKWRRYRRRRCPQCRTRMALMTDSEDDALLQEGQVAEERIGSVDYDVWKCPACAHHFTLRYAKWASTYDKCPQCFNRTKSSTQSVIEAATTSSEGSMRVLEQCAFCSFTSEYTKVLPRVSESRSSSSSGSSSGGSSFGGGRSGGGGASRGY